MRTQNKEIHPWNGYLESSLYKVIFKLGAESRVVVVDLLLKDAGKSFQALVYENMRVKTLR